MERGSVLDGSNVSSTLDEMASKPMKAKKTLEAAPNTPLKPNGNNGLQFAGLMKRTAVKMNKRTTANLITTMTLLTRLVSLTPRDNKVVIRIIMVKAGRLK